MRLVIASHNLMDGRRLAGLLDDHAAVQADAGLDLLCIQENRRPDGSACAPRIAAKLGAAFDFVGDHPRTRLAIVFDRSKLELVRHEVHCLPKLDRLTRFERLFTSVQQKYVQLAVFKTPSGFPFAVANFHLDTAGGNRHRADQISALTDVIRKARLEARLVACGDTNAFSLGRAAQLAKLAFVLAPLAALEVTDPGHAATHFFARQREPRLTHRLAVAVGRVGIDVPNRYDVVCTNLETISRGQRETPDSDHDLVWARVSLR